MARRLRPTALGVTLALYDMWRRLPPKQRRQILNLAREQGPKVAARVTKGRRRRR